MAINLQRDSADLSFASSTLHPDFKILKNTSIFNRNEYQCSFSAASDTVFIGKSVINFQSIGARFPPVLEISPPETALNSPVNLLIL